MKTREQAEARALELFPKVPIHSQHYVTNQIGRQSFLQCWEEMQQNKQTCGFCVEPASKVIKEAFDNIPKEVRDRHAKAAYNEHKQLREAAQSAVDAYYNHSLCGELLKQAVMKIEKALK